MTRHARAWFLLAGLALLGAVHTASGQLLLIDDGRSPYVIYVDPASKVGLKPAAVEMQTYLHKATGVTLPIVDLPTGQMISLGMNEAARQAGVTVQDSGNDAFRVVVKGQSLFLVGNDTEAGQRNATGGVSTGTAFAVSAFLERCVGVRWLIPGPDGEDVPALSSLKVDSSLDWQEAPAFVTRTLQYIHNDRQEVKDWIRHNRLGVGLQVDHGHAWDEYPPRQVLLDHPDYMALVGGQRVKPDKHPTYNMAVYKFCTTNPGLLDAFAQGLVDKYKARGDRYSMSISATDGDGWCECEACSALVIRTPSPRWGDYGGYRVSNTRRLIQFYNEVARRVGPKLPGKMLGAYVYASFTYPPEEPIAVEPNVFLCLAPRPYYGFTLYKPQFRQQYVQLIEAWANTTRNFGYTDYCTWMRNYMGAPLPPAKSILSLVFTTLKRNGARYTYLAGQQAWGYGGLHNYLAARLMWNPDLDIEAEYHEFLRRAYGPGADAMDRFYTLLEEKMAAYEQSTTDYNYEMTTDLMLQVYLANLPQLEAMYNEAASQDLGAAQRARLEMVRDNLRIAHHAFRTAGVLKNYDQSPFYLSDGDYREFRDQTRRSLALVDSPTDDHGEKYGGMTKLNVAENRRVVIPRLAANAKAPVIDGDLSDAAWLTASTADSFRLRGTLDRAVHATVARLVFDEQFLYVAFICEEGGSGGIVANVTGNDPDGIYRDDVVELFFAPTTDFRGHWWHLTANPRGAKWDGLLNKAAYNLDWTSAARIDGDRWMVEIAIPFKGLGLKEAPSGQTWRANLARENPPAGEISSWNKVEQHFAEPQNFGSWYFVKPGEANDTF